jgi:TolB-like protein/Flp pilus assembly protein TadD
MSVVDGSDSHLELAHVLFIDIVGYSKRLTNEQSALVKKLNEMVRQTEECRAAEGAGKLIRIPTGDGMALAFFTSPDAPVRCAIELAKADQADPRLALRMGIHTGPVDQLSDVNERSNVAGAGINIAQRVMDCGDAGHILLSKRTADDLGQYGRWQPDLHELGEVEVKHGLRLGVVNFHGKDFGNAALPQKIAARRQKETSALQLKAKQSRRKRRLLVGTFLGVMAVAIVISIIAYRMSRQLSQDELVRKAASLIPEKSIAVLPFENLIRDPENAFLATGIEDEILTRLSKIAALKVISRTSTKQYESKPSNLSEIAKQLGVATILEGSVQKVGERIRVNVQLIKAATDAHLWAESYDRELIDVLAVESQVASEIAAALRAALTPEEKARLDERPTTNPEAYALYLRAREVMDQAADLRGPLEQAEAYLEQAVAIDPDFALAHVGVGNMLLTLFVVFEPRREFKARAWTEVQEALRLDPNLGEAHEALGLYYDRIDLNYQAAAKEYEIALRTLPNDSVLVRRIGLMHRRQGHWRNGLAEVERAASLDPRNLLSLGWLSGTYLDLHNWAAGEEMDRRGLALAVTGSANQAAEQKFRVGFSHFYGTGDTSLLQKALAEVPVDLDPGGLFTQLRYWAYMYLHDFNAAEKVLERSPLTIIENPWGAPVAKSFLQGAAVAARGDSTRAKLLFEAALPHAENEVKEHPETATRHAQLGIVYADLGRKEDALREGRRAMELLPESKDAYYGVDIANMCALICARLGDGDLAIPLLARLLTTPRGYGLQDLRSSPDWDPLRKDPRFQKILASPEPKVIYN